MRNLATAAALAAAGAVVVGLGARGADVADAAAPHQVVIQGLSNVPETLVVKRGDVVVWVNKDPFPHTVTAAGEFDSGPIAAGKSWRYTARRAGTFTYVCTLHSTMKGTLRVD